MNYYKTVIIVVVSVVFSFLLVPLLTLGWIFYEGNNEVTYEFSQSVDDIVSIEVVKIVNESDIYESNLDSIEVITTIDVELLQEFYDDFAVVPCYKVSFDPVYYFDGEAILINYDGGSFEFIDVYGGYYYNPAKDNESYKYYNFDSESFENLIVLYKS